MNFEKTWSGPYDSADVNAPVELANFGSISFVPSPLVTVRAEIEENTGRIVALSFDYKSSSLQVQAFASPKGEPIWEAVLDDIATNLAGQGAEVEKQIGPFGIELFVEVELPGKDLQRVRMFGVNGERWLLKGTVSGKALEDLEERTFLEDFFKACVVTRGELPLPPRELLPLELPSGAIVPKGSL